MDEWTCPACGSKNRKNMTICRFCRFDNSVNVTKYGAITLLKENDKQNLLARVEEGNLIKMMKSFEKELKAAKEELEELKTSREELKELKAVKEELALLEYETGKHSSVVDAEKWYRKAAEHGNVEAMISLIHCNAKEIKQEWYEEAAKSGDKRAQKYLKEYNFNLREQEAIERNDAREQRKIGDYYYEKGTMSDFAKAVQWYQRAAEQGDIESQIKMGDCCFLGYGIKMDQEKGIEWYEKAANKGDARAQEKVRDCSRKLGNYYYNGQGRERDWGKAKKWYEKAASQNDAEAQKKLGDCYYYGVNKNVKLAESWYKKAAEQGDERAKRMIAVFQSLK